MAEDWLRQYNKDVDRVPKWNGKTSSFRDFDVELTQWLTIKGYWADPDLAVIQGYGDLYMTKTKALALICLTGSTAQRASTVGMESDTFRDSANIKTLWNQSIKPIFIPASDTIFARQEFHGRRQKRGESAQEYCSYKLQLFQQGWSENERSYDTLRKNLINGLIEDVIKSKVNDSAPQNEQELITRVCEITGREQEAYAGGYSKCTSMDGLASCLTTYGATAGAAEAMDVSKAETICYYCDKPGHVKSECRKKIRDEGERKKPQGPNKQDNRRDKPPSKFNNRDNRCRTCNKPGHFAKECRAHIKCRKCEKYGHYASDCRSTAAQSRPGQQGRQGGQTKGPRVSNTKEEHEGQDYDEEDETVGQLNGLHFLD